MLIAGVAFALTSCGACGDHDRSDAGGATRRRDAGARDAGTHDLGTHDAGPPDSGVRYADPDPSGLRGGGQYFEIGDGDLRERLATQPVAEIKRGYGGRSVAFKITLADGTVGYYKPEQTFSAAHWYGEVAAYHLDRLLGLHRVPPCVSRRMAWLDLRRSAPSDEHFPEVTVGDDGTVRGSFSFWVPDHLVPLRGVAGWERWVRVGSTAPGAVSPFQRPRAFAEALAAIRDGGTAPGVPPAGPPDSPDRPAELSDLVVFDYLTGNTDRWGGENANVLTRGRRGALVFLDNGAGFPPGPARSTLLDSRLHAVQRFRRHTVEALRAMNAADLARRLRAEPLAPVLDADQLAAFDVRRDEVLAHVAQQVARYGEADVLAW